MRHLLALFLTLCLSAPALAQQFERVGDLDVHYTIFNSTFLQPDIAKSAGLTRSQNQGVINIIPLRNGQHVEVTVTGEAKNLIGQSIPLSFHRLVEGTAIYNLAQFPIEQRETLTFTITLQEEGQKPETIKLTKEVFPN